MSNPPLNGQTLTPNIPVDTPDQSCRWARKRHRWDQDRQARWPDRSTRSLHKDHSMSGTDSGAADPRGLPAGRAAQSASDGARGPISLNDSRKQLRGMQALLLAVQTSRASGFDRT
jgi:hypothetical protein